VLNEHIQAEKQKTECRNKSKRFVILHKSGLSILYIREKNQFIH